ncbi:hypothetical protein PFISCL1PPCAC_5627, partial [Pristionchus fissidentatus]
VYIVQLLHQHESSYGRLGHPTDIYPDLLFLLSLSSDLSSSNGRFSFHINVRSFLCLHLPTLVLIGVAIRFSYAMFFSC